MNTSAAVVTASPDTIDAPAVQAAVAEYRRRGFAVCRLAPGKKNPTYAKWTTHSLGSDDFGPVDGVGIMAGYLSDGGKPGHALVILDLDDADVLAAADDYLPSTGMSEGRASKPRSHRYYLVPLASIPPAHVAGTGGTAQQAVAAARAAGLHPGPRTRSFSRGKGKGKGEAFRLLGTGGQASAPPSPHPSGERREWDGGEPGEPAVVDYMDLWLSCCQLAEATGCKIPKVDDAEPDEAPASDEAPADDAPPTAGDAPPTANDPASTTVGGVGDAAADQLILDDVAASTTGDKYRRVVRGEFSDFGGDESAAHLALCNWFAVRVGDDPPRVLRLLARLPVVTAHPKWGRGDYWDRTIRRAIADTQKFRKRQTARPSDFTDVANARRMVRDHGERLRYCGPQSGFYVYSPESGLWVRDEARRVEHLAKITSDKMLRAATKAVNLAQGVLRGAPQDAKAIQDAKAADAQLKWALATQRDTRRILNMARLASSEPELAVEPADFDSDPWLLGTPNGVVDLQSGRRLPHSPAHLMTKSTAAPYVPDAAAPTWERFISGVFGGDTELVRWTQRYLGYSLTADVSLQVLPVFWGGGSNGKSTLIDTLQAVVGSYWGKAAPDLLLSKHFETHPTEVANLHGLRLAFSVETDEGRKLNEARVKELTGDATLTARRMRENFWTFGRTNKLVLITNHKPKIETGGDGIWRRLRLVPFVRRFWHEDKGERGPDHLKADIALPAKLLTEAPGILAWLVRGAVECYRDELRLGPCRAITAATAEYQSAEDVFAQFVAECLEVRPGDDGAQTSATEVRERYQRWAADSGAKPLTPRAITEKLAGCGVTSRPSHGKTVYVGLRLV